MAKFGSSSKELNAIGADGVIVRGEHLNQSDRKMASDAISLMSVETDRSNTSAARRSQRNAGK